MRYQITVQGTERWEPDQRVNDTHDTDSPVEARMAYRQARDRVRSLQQGRAALTEDGRETASLAVDGLSTYEVGVPTSIYGVSNQDHQEGVSP